MNWKLSGRASRERVEAALASQGEVDDWAMDVAVGASEVLGVPQEWLFEAWMPRRPTRLDTMRLSRLFEGRAPHFAIERLPDTDWVTASQQSAPPVRVGQFLVRTPDYPAGEETGLIEFEIPAAQAFGTGQHATTAGCLEMLLKMHRRGLRPRNIADIGTGTGILAFAARALWPNGLFTGSDIDPVCGPAVADNAQRNAVPLGERKGEFAFTIAGGMADELLASRAPYDLLIANILAAPLIDLADDFADAVTPRASLVLAGLLYEQERAVRAAYLRAGFRLNARMIRGDWSILWLRRRFAA